MNKVPHFSTVADVMHKQGVPLPQVSLVLAIIFLLVGGVSVLIGYQARVGAALLAVFLVLATFYFHNFWAISDPLKQQEQMGHFLKNLGLFGAMLFLVANGAGAWSIDAARQRRQRAGDAGRPVASAASGAV